MKIMFTLFALATVASCNTKQAIDLLVYNAKVYTVDSAFSRTEAIAVDKGKIIEVGTSADLRYKYLADKELNAEGNYIYPGLIDAHAHFFGYGMSLQIANLAGTKSWEEVLARLKSFAMTNTEGWLEGQGWDQNDWETREFPSNEKLDELFPGRPVILTRVDGHAAIANTQALTLAGVKAGDKIRGGDIEIKNGRLTGLLLDNAMDLVYSKIPPKDRQQVKAALMKAQNNCFAAGLTTVVDCGLNYRQVQLIDSLNKSGELKMRLYVMLSDAAENYDFLFSKGLIKTDHLHIRGFKVFADGALGSRGACLLEPYSDRKDWFGFLLSSPAHFDSVANIIYDHKLQMCTHAIGDSANRVILNTYAKYLKGKNDLRWRIEHAQVINKNDFHLFGQYNIIPSVQPTHATSDMYWAEDRLGRERIKGAYAFKELLEQNKWLPLGTDFPVEDISPLKTFFASVTRKDAKGWPPNGFQPGNALSREEALRGMTIWAAKGNFEEHEKGSLQPGKLADFVIMDRDLMEVAAEEIPGTKVLKTFLGGEVVFERK